MSGSPSLITQIVQAGAGTGKTESLAREIIRVAEVLYERKGIPPRLVATTFTERATSELRERVVTLAAKKSDAPDWLRAFVQDTRRLHISTIHGTLSLILHRFGALLGLDPEFTIIGAPEEKNILSRLLRGVLSEHSSFGFLADQYSFKDLISIIQSLISHWRLHGEAFQPALNWSELLEADVTQLIGALDELNVTTGDEFPPALMETLQGLMALRTEGKVWHKDFPRWREGLLRVLDGRRKPSLTDGRRGFHLKSAIDGIFSLKDKWAEETCDPLVNGRHDQVSIMLEDLTKVCAEKLLEHKHRLGLVTFEDLEFLAADLVSKLPDAVKSIQDDWDFWFVDEYQDTSPLQKKLLLSFFKNNWNAYFVGDPQQSIYLFRGADQNVFQDTKALVAQNEGLLGRLDVNYRSHPDLLKFMNFLFASFEKPLEILKAKGPEENQIRAEIHLCPEGVSEELTVAHQVWEWKKQGHEFHEIGVLVRTNAAARYVAKILSQSGIPVFIHSTGGFYDRREVIDAVALLSFLEDPSDDELLVLLARSPWMGIPDERLVTWGKAVKESKKSFWQWLSENPQERSTFQSLDLLAVAVREAETWPLSVVFERALENLGFFEFCLVGDASGRREANVRKLMETLRRHESRTGFCAGRFIEGIWQDLSDSGEENEAASFIEPRRVNIMTIHKSKGLKFQCVAVPYCSDAVKVNYQPLELAPDGHWAIQVLSPQTEEKVSPLTLKHLKEERGRRESDESLRVFYVAVTRAAEKLALIGKDTRAPKSWFSRVGVNFSDGEHEEGYRVRLWKELTFFETAPEKKEFFNPETEDWVPSGKGGVSALPSLYSSAAGTKKKISIMTQLEAQQYGLALHFIFEEMKNDPQAELHKLCELAHTRFGTAQKPDFATILKTLDMQEPPLRKLIQDGQKEWPFVFREAERDWVGRIDLWGDCNGITWIIDYKSAKKFSEEAGERAQKQLRFYALAIHKVGRPWKNIRLAVVTPMTGESHEISLGTLEEVRADLSRQFLPSPDQI